MHGFDLVYFLKGMIVGISIAAPVGPIGILCIKRTLNYGLHAGFLTGFGAATADALFAIVAGFGLTAISTRLDANRMYFEMIGGTVLIVMAYLAYLKRKRNDIDDNDNGDTLKSDNFIKEYFTAFFLTITNPITVLGLMALFAALGINHATTTALQTWMLVLGVFAGSSLWFSGLAAAVGFFIHHRLTAHQMTKINIFSSVLFLVFGIAVLIDAFLLMKQ